MRVFLCEGLLILFQVMNLILIFFAPIEIGIRNYALILFGAIIIILFLMRRLLNKFGDPYIFLLSSFLVSLGLMMIFRLDSNSGIKQGFLLLSSLFIYVVVAVIAKRYPHPEHLFYPVIIFSILFFVLTLILGKRTYGAVNWIDAGIFKFQPAEFIKIATVFFIAIYYNNPEVVSIKNEDNKYGILIFEGDKEIYLPVSDKFPISKYNELWKKYGGFLISLIVYIEIGFLFLQKDLGTAVLFFVLLMGIQFIYEKNRYVVLTNILLAIVASIIAFFIFNHVRVRIDAWLRPMDFADGKGYQIIQSQIAIASGGLFGSGLFLGFPKFIPAVKTDFIFSAICEEMGVFTGIAVILIFMLIVYRGFKIALRKPNNLWGIVALGLSIVLGSQAFIILGGVTRLIPMTGITLPFVSYGGSSLIANFIIIALMEVASEK